MSKYAEFRRLKLPLKDAELLPLRSKTWLEMLGLTDCFRLPEAEDRLKGPVTYRAEFKKDLWNQFQVLIRSIIRILLSFWAFIFIFSYHLLGTWWQQREPVWACTKDSSMLGLSLQSFGRPWPSGTYRNPISARLQSLRSRLSTTRRRQGSKRTGTATALE